MSQGRPINPETAIARTSWPIELHNAPEGLVWDAFSEDHVHYVPCGR